jgi:hypothetical protein
LTQVTPSKITLSTPIVFSIYSFQVTEFCRDVFDNEECFNPHTSNQCCINVANFIYCTKCRNTGTICTKCDICFYCNRPTAKEEITLCEHDFARYDLKTILTQKCKDIGLETPIRKIVPIIPKSEDSPPPPVKRCLPFTTKKGIFFCKRRSSFLSL